MAPLCGSWLMLEADTAIQQHDRVALVALVALIQAIFHPVFDSGSELVGNSQ